MLDITYPPVIAAAKTWMRLEGMRFQMSGTEHIPRTGGGLIASNHIGYVDFVFNGPDRQFISGALGFAYRGPAAEPKQHGEFGLSARWSPEILDGTVGFYYRNYADKLPQVLITSVPLASRQYNLIYADNIQLFGTSIAKNIGGVSTSAEISYRKNTPLNAQVLGIAQGLPSQGDTKGPRGDTWHGLVNAIGTISKTPLA